ncbi:MAG: hypothetical protein P4L74_04690 [Candidatus Doudnabacteria bacterium]|nr:hypothetical protein [Candidatus Doudnabacteria bacterium]
MSLFTDKVEIGIQEAELDTQKIVSGIPPIFIWIGALIILTYIPGYFIAKSSSYKIWLARYEQGAVAAKQSFLTPQNITISPASIDTLGAGQFSAVVKIANPNLDLSLDNIAYTLDFFNAAGQQVYSYPGTFFLLPNQTKYLTIPTFSSNEQISSARLTLPPNLPWQKRLQIPAVDLEPSLPSHFNQQSPPAFVVQGDFLNNSPYTLNKVRLTFILYNSSGQIIGSSLRVESTVAPFERRAYKQLWPNATVPNLSRVEVTADTDVLDPTNLSAPAIGSSSAADLSRPKTGQ